MPVSALMGRPGYRMVGTPSEGHLATGPATLSPDRSAAVCPFRAHTFCPEIIMSSRSNDSGCKQFHSETPNARRRTLALVGRPVSAQARSTGSPSPSRPLQDPHARPSAAVRGRDAAPSPRFSVAAQSPTQGPGSRPAAAAADQSPSLVPQRRLRGDGGREVEVEDEHIAASPDPAAPAQGFEVRPSMPAHCRG